MDGRIRVVSHDREHDKIWTGRVMTERIITFANGILGFPKYKRYVLLQPNEDSYFYWLQCVETPDLAFVVTDPRLFVSTYRIPFKHEQMQEMGILSLDDAEVFVIVNKHE